MKSHIKQWFSALLALVFFAVFSAALMIYVPPMEDVTLNLSMMLDDGVKPAPDNFDSKGWTVYTNDAGTVTELTPDGLGGFTGLELGQTFYFSRVMEEDLDRPTLQIPTVDRTFSVWLDDALIYTDHPELDNRVGYLTLPMNEWDRSEPITISLPADYTGKTLTVAQSFPEYTETSSVRAYPAEITLYCGYAYESGLISESFATALLMAAAFLVGVILLVAFVLHQDWSVLCLSLVSFLWMVSLLSETSFFWEYFGTFDNSLLASIPLVSVGALLLFLTLRSGRRKKVLWAIVSAYLLSVAAASVVLYILPNFGASNVIGTFLAVKLPSWLAFISLAVILVLAVLFWRKESWFWQVFTPLAILGVVAYWSVTILFVERGIVADQIINSLKSGYIDYIYYRTLPGIKAAALVTAVVEAVKRELDRRREKHLLEERYDLAQASYESMRHQHEEVMMLRHDMVGHFVALKELVHDEQAAAYLDELIGKNKKIRQVVQTGNEMLDIILNNKLSAASDARIKVDIIKAEAPEKLPFSDADLCSLVMNIMNNALTAATASAAAERFIRLDVHVKSDYFALICENSANMDQIMKKSKKETVPKHGLGLKIIQETTERYQGLIDTEYSGSSYKVRIAIPLFNS